MSNRAEIIFTIIGAAVMLTAMLYFLSWESKLCDNPHNASLAFCSSNNLNNY